MTLSILTQPLKSGPSTVQNLIPSMLMQGSLPYSYMVQNWTKSIVMQPLNATAGDGADSSVVQNCTPSIVMQPSGETATTDADPAAIVAAAITL